MRNIQIEREPDEAPAAPPATPDPFAVLSDMIALFAQPTKARALILQFQEAKLAAETAERHLAAARVAHDEYIRKTTAELDGERERAGKLWKRATERESDIKQREEFVFALEK